MYGFGGLHPIKHVLASLDLSPKPMTAGQWIDGRAAVGLPVRCSTSSIRRRMRTDPELQLADAGRRGCRLSVSANCAFHGNGRAPPVER